MKQLVKGIMIGVLSTLLIVSSIAIYAAETTQIEVLMNQINIAINGTTVGKIGEDYQLSNGEFVPNTLVYKGTTYLPMRKVAELLGKDVSWDGNTTTAGINDKIAVEPETVVPQTGVNLSDTANSRTNPLPLGSSVLVNCDDYSSGKYQIEIALKNVIRGEEAWNMVYTANQFNDPADEGFEYLLGNFEIKVIKTVDDAQIKISETDFETVSSDGVVYEMDWSVDPEPSIASELYQGSSTMGYSTLLVSIGDEPVIRYEYEYGKYVWFSIK